jgi:hypothetical protein
LDGYDAVVVEPYAVEDELRELALGVRVGLVLPEDGEVFERRASGVEVEGGLGRERRQLGVDGIAAGDVVGARQVA